MTSRSAERVGTTTKRSPLAMLRPTANAHVPPGTAAVTAPRSGVIPELNVILGEQAMTSQLWAGVYAGSTPLSFGVFGRHRRGLDPVEPCGFARLSASSDDN
jgi:hypothetical protein